MRAQGSRGHFPAFQRQSSRSAICTEPQHPSSYFFPLSRSSAANSLFVIILGIIFNISPAAIISRACLQLWIASDLLSKGSSRTLKEESHIISSIGSMGFVHE
ncbi:hypothetical protein MRB53_023060 [Persea americana]|uniref:Uncharacterized protein n=1 Tax=Persea americana TaxID=3435 RepID=A0ACC2L8Q5_PERAE|nr:hypothetical protein MRB53_023060 [Persea americana]